MPDQFISGALCCGFWVSALFFFRFWRTTHDRLFLIFAISFLLMGVERVVLTWTAAHGEFEFSAYGIRLLAFLLLIFAILDKNRKS